MRKRFPPATSLKEIDKVLQEEWHKISLETIRNLYESIPRSVAVLLIKKCVQYL
jgi:hypothetical protein